MDKPKKDQWNIFLGAGLVVLMANTLPMFLGGSTPANIGVALSFLVIVFGFYLVYRGFRPKSR